MQKEVWEFVWEVPLQCVCACRLGSYSYVLLSVRKEAAREWFVVSGEGVQPDTRSKTGSRYFGNIRSFLQERPTTPAPEDDLIGDFFLFKPFK